MAEEDEKKTPQDDWDEESSCSSDSSFDLLIPSPPDGGYGWVIVLASLASNIIVDGIGYTFGIFMPKFVDEFKESKFKVALVGSLLCGTYLCAGPVVSALTNLYGCRKVAVAGSLIATVGFVLSMFAPTVEILMLTYGVIGGFGFGMIYLPSIVSVGYYFERKRALATGIAVCGSGIGTFVMAPLTKFLLDEMNWQGAMLILAGLILQGAIFGMLMRPLEPLVKPKKKKMPREKNLIDRLKEQARWQRKRQESECSYAYGVRDPSQVLERVLEAKLLREQILADTPSSTKETESELGSLPSLIFVKGIGRQNSRDARHKLSLTLSDRNDQLSVLTDPAQEDGSISMAAGDEGGDPSDVGTPRTGTPMASPSQPSEMTFDPEQEGNGTLPNGGHPRDGDVWEQTEETSTSPHSRSRLRKSSSRNSESDGPLLQRLLSTDSKRQAALANGVGAQQPEGQAELQALLDMVGRNDFVVKVSHDGTKEIWERADKQGKRKSKKRDKNKPPPFASLRSLGANKEDLARPLYRKDIFYSGSVINIPEYRSQPDMRSYITSITAIPGLMPDVGGGSLIWDKGCRCLPKSIRDTLSSMLDVSLLKDPKFLLIGVANLFVFLGFYVPFVYLVDRSISIGIDAGNAAILLSIIGATNTAGRVAAGWLADLQKVNSLVINNVAMLISGIITILTPFCNTYPLLITVAAVFGLCVAAFISLSSIILCDLLGLEKLTNAFGLLTLFRGIAAIAGPPLAGYVFDATDSYDISFFLGGGLLILGAGLHFLLHLPCLRGPAKPAPPPPFPQGEDFEVEISEIHGPQSDSPSDASPTDV